MTCTRWDLNRLEACVLRLGSRGQPVDGSGG